MGSSLVKPSQRESRRRGVNDARASGGNAPASNGNFDGQKDNGYKVDTLARPVSNYCKPVTVISPNENIKTVPQPSKIDSTSRSISSFPNEKENSFQPLPDGRQPSDYICPVLQKDFRDPNKREDKNSPKLLKKSLSSIGDGENRKAIPSAAINQDRSKNRKRRLFPASCIGKQSQTSEASIGSPKPLETKGDVKHNEKGKVDLKPDDQDVSRDARTPSPVFNDFENAIVTKPTAMLPYATISSPIDKYTHTEENEVVGQDSSASVSITTSEIPAPIHQSELRCELNKKEKTSNTTLTNDLKHTGGKENIPETKSGSKTMVNKDYDTQRDRHLERGDSLSQKSSEEKEMIHSIEKKTGLKPLLKQHEDDHKMSTYVHNYPSKDCASYFGFKPPNSDYKADSEQEKGQVNKNTYICANVKIENKVLQEIPGLQGCATGATKCFCDVNQFDYDVGDDLHKSQVPTILRGSSDSTKATGETKAAAKSTDIGMKRIMGLYKEIDKTDVFRSSKLEKEQHLNNSDALPTSGSNKSESDLQNQFRISRLNCLRPDGGGCTLGKFSKDKRQKVEPRPASWSHINPKLQNGDNQPIIRPYSAATGDAPWGEENAINMAIVLASTSSSALDVSPSRSNSSTPTQQRSRASVDDDRSGHSEVKTLRDAANKSSRHLLSSLEVKITSLTQKTSHCNIEAVTTQRDHDLSKPLSAEKVTDEHLRQSRPASARSSCASPVEVSSRLSQHSLPRLQPRGSGLNVSRSLSNHSSGCDMKHCPRPPSTDSLKHSPRPPSALSEEGSVRKVRSRASSVQLSGPTTTDLKQSSNHSLTKDHAEKPSFNQTKDQFLHSATAEGDILSSKHALKTSQIKLPPIKTTVNIAQSMDSTASLNQPVRLPPVVCAEYVVRPCQPEEKVAPKEDADTLGSWGKPCSLLPPVGEREALPLGRSTIEQNNMGDFKTCLDSTVTEQRSYLDGRANSTGSPKNLNTSESPLGKICSSSTQERTFTHENIVGADPKPSPNDSHVDCGEMSYSSLAKKTSSDEIARILAKYSSTPQSTTPLDTTAANDTFSATLTSDYTKDVKVKASEEDERVDSMKSFDTSLENFKNSDLCTQDYIAANDTCSTTHISDNTQEAYAMRDSGVMTSEKDEIEYAKNLGNYLENRNDFDLCSKNYNITSSEMRAQDHTAANDTSSVMPVDNCVVRSYNNCDIKETSTEKDEVGSREYTIDNNFDKVKDSDMCTKDYTSISCKEHDATSNLLGSKYDYSPRNLSENTGEPKQPVEIKDKDGANEVKTDKTSAEYPKPSSPAECKDLLSSYLPPPEKQDNDEFATCDKPADYCPALPEATGKSESYSTGKFDYESLLEKYSMGSTNKKPDTENNTERSGGKSDDTDELKPTATIAEPGDSQFSASEYISKLLAKNSVAYTTSSKETVDAPVETEDHTVKPKSDSIEEIKPSSMFDIASIMARYSSGKADDEASPSETLACTNRVDDSISMDKEDIISVREDDKGANMSPANEKELENSEYRANPTTKVDGFSEEEKAYTVEATNPEKIETPLNNEKNCDNDAATLTNSTNITVVCPTNGQITQTEDKVACYSFQEERDFTMPTRIEENSSTDEGFPKDNSDDYINDLSQRLSGFGEQIADISSLTESCTNKDAAEVSTMDTAPDDKVGENNGKCLQELENNAPDDNYCEPNVPDASKENIDVHPDVKSEFKRSLPSTIDSPQAEGDNQQSDKKTPNIDKGENKTRNLNIDSAPDGAYVDSKMNENSDEENQRTHTECATVNSSDSDRKMCSPEVGTEQSNLLSTENSTQEDCLSTNPDETIGTSNCKTSCSKTKTDGSIANNATTNFGSNGVADDLSSDIKSYAEPNETITAQLTSNVSPSQSHSRTSEDNLKTNSTENLPSGKIDTIKKQIYEEGLKPCQRDGGVAFFIPASNTGLQPAVNNPDLGDRLAKPKKPSMSYEERMIMADINRQEQLTKRKEFAVKDLINVKSATWSNSSASGENISGEGQNDRSDRSDSGNLH